MAASFSWGGQTWSYGDLSSFKSYLSAHGTSYATWAANHPDAASILTSAPTSTETLGGISVSQAQQVATNYNVTPDTSASLAQQQSEQAGSPPQESPATSSTSSSSGSSSGGSTAPATAAPPDWDTILGEYGLPSDVIAQLNNIWTAAGSNVSAAVTLAQAYIRGTTWYAQTYPGIQQGINAGLFTDEQSYRAYENQVDQIYQQYWGRPATSAELNARITSGQSVSQVANQFQSGAILGNISDPLKGLFTADELKAYSNEQAGIDTALGQQISQEANMASQINTLYNNFYGRNVTRSELDQVTSQGLDPSAVAQQFATQSNINAMDPAIKDLFTPAEIQQIALQAAGGTTQNGQQLSQLASLATQLNPLYHQYTGAGVSRDEINAAYSAGTTPTQIGQQLSGAAWEKANEADIQQTSGAFGTGQLSSTDLQNLGNQEGGYDTPAGQALLTAFQKAQQRMQGAFKGTLANPSVTNLLKQPTQADVAA